MSNFSQGVTNLQNNMHSIFGNLKKRHNGDNNNNNNNSTDAFNDRQDLMEDDDDYDIDNKPKKKENTRRPKENDFTQQRLKAIHPILTARTIIPLFIILAIIFIPIGGAMLNSSNKIQDFTINYATCSTDANENDWTEIPSKYYTHHFKNDKDLSFKPKWKLSTNDSYVWADYPEESKICQVQFQIPNDLPSPIYFFYKLTNFHANHRQYVKSFSEDQINGKAASVGTIKDSVGQNCQPLSTDKKTGKIIYPCGLIANAMFNDTFDPILQNIDNNNNNYQFSTDDISWSTNKNRFKKTKYKIDDIVPPPNWVKQFPNGYNSSNLPDISSWPQFQNWMAPAALSDFSNIILRNDNDNLPKGNYQINIGLHFPTTEYKGGKYIYISTSSSIGGKNAFLGVSWIVGGIICLGLAFILGFGVLVRGRKAGDIHLLSWNKE